MNSFLIEIEGYRARVERGRDGIFYGRAIDLEELVYFKAATARLLEHKFALALEGYFRRCKETGQEIKKPAAVGI